MHSKQTKKCQPYLLLWNQVGVRLMPEPYFYLLTFLSTRSCERSPHFLRPQIMLWGRTKAFRQKYPSRKTLSAEIF
jgi:hypothetical protein